MMVWGGGGNYCGLESKWVGIGSRNFARNETGKEKKKKKNLF
jgi:hypothetical protein